MRVSSRGDQDPLLFGRTGQRAIHRPEHPKTRLVGQRGVSSKLPRSDDRHRTPLVEGVIGRGATGEDLGAGLQKLD